MNRPILAVAAALFLAGGAPAAAVPLTCEARWTDAGREREVPVRIRMPEGEGRVAAILFSHGLGGWLDSGTVWAETWREAGFAVINLQHPGSDRSIIGGGRIGRAMSPEQLEARARDVAFVIDRIAAGGRAGACDLGRIDGGQIGLAGHSFGAITAQAVAGQVFPGRPSRPLADPRIRAAVALSPSPPLRGSADRAFADIRIPFFSITGTQDVVPFLRRITPADRERPFRAMPAGGKYLLVLEGVDHGELNGQPGLPHRNMLPDARTEAIIGGATTDFWRWTLLGDAAARRRLDQLPRRIGEGDRFEAK